MTTLTAHQLTLAYAGRDVLRDFSLHTTGGVLGLVGPNGSGKTTALRALAGLHRPRCGEICLDGRNVTRMSALERARQIALVPQGETHTWPLTVRDVTLLGRAAHRGWLLPFSRTDHAAVDRALDQTGLTALQSQRLDKLSGGERQRTLIARALAQEAQVLLLDEPTASLDIRFQIQILDLVRCLAIESKLLVVIAIHDLTLAARTCDRLMLLHQGRVFASGAPPNVLTTENLSHVFGLDGEIYRDPRGQWALSVMPK